MSISLNSRALEIVETLLARADERRVLVREIEGGGRLVDCGIEARGGWCWVGTAGGDRFHEIVEGVVVWHQRERSVDVWADCDVARWCCSACVLDSGAEGDKS